MRAGSHVMTEKPMATRWADVVEMNRVARETGQSIVRTGRHRSLAAGKEDQLGIAPQTPYDRNRQGLTIRGQVERRLLNRTGTHPSVTGDMNHTAARRDCMA